MFDARHALVLAATLTLAAPVFAQQQQQGTRLDDLDATRINPFQIVVDFDFDGGACDQVGRPEVGEVVDGTVSINFPVTTTGDVCTMQVKEHDVKFAIEAEHIISRVDVTVTGKDGQVIGTGSTDVDQD